MSKYHIVGNHINWLILNMVVPILMHFYPYLPFKSFSNQSMQAAGYITKCDVDNDVKLFPTVYPRYDVANYPLRCQVTIASALEMSCDMRFTTMWCVQPAKAQTSLHIRAV